MTKENIYTKVLTELHTKALAEEFEKESYGICYLGSRIILDKYPKQYVEADILAFYRFVRLNCQNWEYFSGDSSYPVPTETNENFCDNPWKGTQQAYRLSLLEHLMKQIDLGAKYD